MFNKIETHKTWLTPAAAEALADLLYEIGKDVHKNGDSYRAAKWLERAHQTLGECDMESMSADVGELRLSIMHLLGIDVVKRVRLHLLANRCQVRTLMDDAREASQAKAQQLIALMETVS